MEQYEDFSRAVMSLHAGDVVHSRYFEKSTFDVKPGHRSEFAELVKLYEGIREYTQCQLVTFDSYYGVDNGGMYIAISKMTSLAEDDASMGDEKKFADAMGAAEVKKVRELTAACVESQSTNLFAFSPKMSYPNDAWVKADAFWKPKAAPMGKKAATSSP